MGFSTEVGDFSRLTYHNGKPKIVSQQGSQIPGSGESRKIAGGPLYPAAQILAMLSSTEPTQIVNWTKKCIADAAKWELEESDIRELLELALRNGRFCGSEWCEQGNGGPWAACDAYSLIRREQYPNLRKEFDMEYYIKFAIAKSGRAILVASCHG